MQCTTTRMGKAISLYTKNSLFIVYMLTPVTSSAGLAELSDFAVRLASIDTSAQSKPKGQYSLKLSSSGADYRIYTYGPIKINVRIGDMLDFPADAVVNGANEACLGGGGIDGQISKRGGKPLAEAREKLPEVTNNIRCPTGQARLTVAGNLSYADPVNKKIKKPFGYVIHAVAPQCDGDMSAENKYLLANAYIKSLERAAALNKDPQNPQFPEFKSIQNPSAIKSISFCTLGTGIFGCVPEISAPLVVNAVLNYLSENPNSGIEQINFMFFDPTNITKAQADFDLYTKALDAKVSQR